MTEVTSESWRALPDRSDLYAELAAEAIAGVDNAFLAVDHDGGRHLLLAIPSSLDPVHDERSRGIRARTRQLTVQSQPEREFIDVICTAGVGQDVFDLVSTAILAQMENGSDPVEAVRTTLARWRRFWGAAPQAGLTPEEVRGLFGELWFLGTWLLPRDHGQVAHWLGPTGTRHDFQWPDLAVEVKATTSTRGHIHRVNGIDQLETPVGAQLCLFSLRVREEATGSNSLVTLIESISDQLSDDPTALDGFETRLSQAGYSAAESDRYGESRFRVVSERLYEVADGFPRLSSDSFSDGLPDGIERVEYDINLDSCHDLLRATSPEEMAAFSF